MVTVESVKNYIRANDVDDAIVTQLIATGTGYLEGAIDNYASRYEAGTAGWQAKADLAVMQFCAWNYEHRGDDDADIPKSLRLLITQLQLEGATE